MSVMWVQVRSSQTKDYNISICGLSANHTGERTKTDWLEIRIMCPFRVKGYVYPPTVFHCTN